MQARLIQIFINLAGMMLLIIAYVLLACCLPQKGAVAPQVPIFMISLSYLFFFGGVVSALLALKCLFGRPTPQLFALLMWFSINILLYRMCLAILHIDGGFIGFLGNVESCFPISACMANFIFCLIITYLAIGSTLSLVLVTNNNHVPSRAWLISEAKI